MINAALLADSSVSIDASWLIAGGFFVAFGTALYNLIPWAMKKGLEDVVDQRITPKLDAVNKRIDEHMGKEEDSFGSIEASVANVTAQLDARTTVIANLHDEVVTVGQKLDDRTQLFDNLQSTMERTQNVLQKHLEDDKTIQEAARVALTAGQQLLLERLDRLEHPNDPPKP